MAAEPDVDPPVNESLWFIPNNCEGKHYLQGNPHTFTGRMSAWCPRRRTGYFISANEITEASPEARAWVAGFLVGNEPTPPLDENGQTDFGSAEYDCWAQQVEAFHRSGQWTDPADVVLSPEAKAACETLGLFPSLFNGSAVHPLSGRSMRDLLAGLDYAQLRRSIDRCALAAFLEGRPEVIEAWQSYSSDKRTTGGFYFVAETSAIGGCDVGHGRVDPLHYGSAAEACAVFILQELDYWQAMQDARFPRKPAPPPNTIVLRIDRMTARALWDVLYAQGEHQAAGRPIPVLDAHESEDLGRILADLGRALGKAGRTA